MLILRFSRYFEFFVHFCKQIMTRKLILVCDITQSNLIHEKHCFNFGIDSKILLFCVVPHQKNAAVKSKIHVA